LEAFSIKKKWLEMLDFICQGVNSLVPAAPLLQTLHFHALR
jgi:hypothetical protein